jgi:hypothetical protein
MERYRLAVLNSLTARYSVSSTYIVNCGSPFHMVMQPAKHLRVYYCNYIIITLLYYIILFTRYDSYMFWPFLLPSTGRCLTRDILQKLFEQMHKCKILSFKTCRRHIMCIICIYYAHSIYVLCVQDTVIRLYASVGFIAISNQLNAWSWIILKKRGGGTGYPISCVSWKVRSLDSCFPGLSW